MRMRGFIGCSSNAHGLDGCAWSHPWTLQRYKDAFDDVDRRIERFPLDDQRGSQSHDRLARLLGEHAALQQPLAKGTPAAPRWVDVDANQESPPAHFPDRRVTDVAEPAHQVCAQLGRALDQLILAQ